MNFLRATEKALFSLVIMGEGIILDTKNVFTISFGGKRILWLLAVTNSIKNSFVTVAKEGLN